MRRVVVTGLGVVSPLGCGLHNSWKNLIKEQCGVSKLPKEKYGRFPCRVAALVPQGSAPGALNVAQYFKKGDVRSMTPATIYALIAAEEALEDSNWIQENEYNKDRTGVAVGTGMVDLADICETNNLLTQSYSRVSPFFVPRILPNMPAGHISMKYGFRGPIHAVSTACATGLHAIGDAFRFIKYNDADVMVCGGSEACISPLAIAGFCRLRALSTSFNDNPKGASRPFDKSRDGFVMGEGAAILILEELSHAVSRSAKIYAEVLGYGLSGDAAHLTAPHNEGVGAVLAMQRCLHEAEIDVHQISYINAHATSTPLGDAVEAKAIRKLFHENCSDIAVSSTKGAHGHLLGAAGSLEAVFTVMACFTGIIPATLNVDELSDNIDLNIVKQKSESWTVETKNRVCLKNSFGFGGTNASICVSEYRE